MTAIETYQMDRRNTDMINHHVMRHVRSILILHCRLEDGVCVEMISEQNLSTCKNMIANAVDLGA